MQRVEEGEGLGAVTILDFGGDVGHYLCNSVVIAGAAAAAVWFAEAFLAEGACFRYPIFLWYGSAVVVVEFGDVVDGVGVVGRVFVVCCLGYCCVVVV